MDWADSGMGRVCPEHGIRDWVVKALNEDMPYDEFVQPDRGGLPGGRLQGIRWRPAFYRADLQGGWWGCRGDQRGQGRDPERPGGYFFPGLPRADQLATVVTITSSIRFPSRTTTRLPNFSIIHVSTSIIPSGRRRKSMPTTRAMPRSRKSRTSSMPGRPSSGDGIAG